MQNEAAMKPTPQELALNDALTSLERALLTPVIAGELADWVQTVEQAAAALAQPLDEFIHAVLHKQYAEIAKADTELLFRVQQMIASDQAVLASYEQFQAKVAGLARRAPAAQQDEGKVASPLAAVEQEGTALILAIRKQQAAASAWLDEALYRDRGPVD
jgi:hypothetical protein